MARTVSKIITINIAPAGAAPSVPSAPSWVTALAINNWEPVALSGTFAAVDPEDVDVVNPDYPGDAPWRNGKSSGQQSVITAYNGGTLCANIGTKGSLAFFGGGHHDYLGNEVYLLDLATLVVSRKSNPYPTVSDSAIATDGWWPAHTGQPNGSPGVPHTYNQFDYDPVRKCLITLRCQANTSPSVTTKIGLFPLSGSPLTENQWQEGTKFAGTKYPVLTGGWMAYDSLRNKFLTHGGSGSSNSILCSVDPSTGSSQGSYGSWTEHGAKSSRTYQSADYDPINDLIVIFDGGTGRLQAMPAGTLTDSVTTLTVSGLPAGLGTRCGFRYSLALGGFVVWYDGAPTYLLTKGPGAWNTATWIFTSLVDPDQAAADVPTRAPNGTYNRFRVMTYSDAEVALVMNGTTQALYAFRLA